MSAQFVEQFVLPIYCAVMEEAIDQGFILLPASVDFWDRPGALLRSRWIGPARGYIDVVKEGEGAALRMENLTSTLEKESAEQGEDWEENIGQIARENKVLAQHGLSRMSIVAVVQSTKGPKPDSGEVEGAADAGDDETGKGNDP